MTKDIELALAKGKIVGARKLLQEYYEAQDKQEFEAKLRAEYDEMYPEYREPTMEEMDTQLEEYKIENTDDTSTDGFVIQGVVIDYSQDENYVTLEEYKNETKSVLIGTEIAYDDNGEEYTKEIFEDQLVRPYIPTDVTDKVEAYLQPILDAKAKEEAQEYLNSTDWYITRQAETGVEVPAEVLTKRQECRELL